jgi:hypothetical protein
MIGGWSDQAAPWWFRRRRIRGLATTALVSVLLSGTAEHAGAAVWSNFTTSGSITLLPGNDTLSFTFDGKSAAYTDDMNIILSSSAERFIVNNRAVPGSTFTVTGLSPGQAYDLELTDAVTGEHWSSDPAKDGTTTAGVTYASDLIDGRGASCSHGKGCAQAPHLAYTTLWDDFGFGGTAPEAPGSIYYGWEDLPITGGIVAAGISGRIVTQITTGGGSGDYNDLVFHISQSASPARVSEPASLVLFCAGLVGTGLTRRRRWAAAIRRQP